MSEEEVVVGLLAWLIAFGFLGRYVSQQCGRSTTEGIFLGCIFGPLGAILVAIMPRPTESDSEWKTRLLESVARIEEDVKWQRSQKEKEIVRSKASHSGKPSIE
jgi:alpha/beta superfamily hydrolase